MTKPIFSPSDMGAVVRAERKALGRTQAWVAQRAGVRRETVTQLERGENVGAFTLLNVLAALGKGLLIVDRRVEVDRLREIFRDDQD